MSTDKPTPQEIWIDTPHGRVHGMAAGPEDGRLIIGLHGWSQRNDWRTWEPLLAPLGDAGFYAISLDMPGWGDTPAWEKTPGKSAVTAVLDGLGRDAYALMGKSWGGGVAIDFAHTHPPRVEKLILTAPAFKDDPAVLERLTKPVLLAWAENDPVIPFAMASKMADLLPDCTLVTYADGGHSAAPKNADDFAPRAIQFLTKK